MLKKIACSVVLMVLLASASLGQSRTMYIGDVELRLGMSQDVVMRLLSKYKLSVTGTSFMVMQYNQVTKIHEILGGVAFAKDQLSYISRSLDTSAWPTDEGFSVGRAIYDALNGSIGRTKNN